ncbi:hypothetical protein Nepgr_008358 [Nepenthes gracilis]|uniref:Uncharacterized protein n=1 Tax=Nepenthes gracilis TaxID=150966 RepID=A0AAD3S8T4_NEPGR|nr:hypothetical protein Nepgr_008358 [Nepenthes gracilis]
MFWLPVCALFVSALHILTVDTKCKCIQDELVNQDTKLTNLTNKLDKEIHVLRAQLEAAKHDVIK